MADKCALPAELTAFIIRKASDGTNVIDQNSYLRKLETLSMHAAFTNFLPMQMHLSWLSHSEPDCLFKISQPVQITEYQLGASKHAALTRLILIGSPTSEKRVVLDIAVARHAVRVKVISGFGFARSSHNIADGLTTPTSEASLRQVICTRQLHFCSEQWIIRSETSQDTAFTRILTASLTFVYSTSITL